VELCCCATPGKERNHGLLRGLPKKRPQPCVAHASDRRCGRRDARCIVVQFVANLEVIGLAIVFPSSVICSNRVQAKGVTPFLAAVRANALNVVRLLLTDSRFDPNRSLVRGKTVTNFLRVLGDYGALLLHVCGRTVIRSHFSRLCHGGLKRSWSSFARSSPQKVVLQHSKCPVA
jgi:hypothetical protein